MEKLIPFLLLSLIFASPVLADTTNYCQDNTTLVKVSTTLINVPELGIQRTMNSTENQTCDYGCDLTHNRCLDSPSHNWLIAMFIILGLVAIIFILGAIFG